MDLKELLKWSNHEFNYLPWRKNRSLYRTLVSEIMLQQTTVSTVINHFDKFIEKYPNFDALAASTEEEICMAWKGLGYYRRARNLRLAAIDIAANNSRVPTSLDKLKEIHGIGEYTANALISIGRNKPALALDANLERVISRLYAVKEEKGPKLQKKIQKLFVDGFIFPHLDKSGPRAVNEALMDMGRVYCQANKTDCVLCPLSRNCQAYQLNEVTKFPKVKKVIKETHELELVRFVVKKGRKVLAYQKTKTEWLSGQLEIPTYILNSSDKELRQYPKLPKKLKITELKKFKTAITKYKITNYIYEIDKKEFDKLVGIKKKYSFVENNPEKVNFSTATIKTFTKL